MTCLDVVHCEGEGDKLLHDVKADIGLHWVATNTCGDEANNRADGRKNRKEERRRRLHLGSCKRVEHGEELCLSECGDDALTPMGRC